MLVKVLEEWSIVIRQVVGLGLDGASVMTGQHNSIIVQLKGQQPPMVYIHCAVKRVALALKDEMEGVQSVQDCKLCLQQIFKLYKALGGQTHHLMEIDTLDQSEYLCLKHCISPWWLSLGKAVKDVKNFYLALVKEAKRNNLTAAVTYLLSSVIPLTEKLNLTFQKNAVNLADIQPVVASTKASLKHLLTTPGHNNQKFSTTVIWDGGVFQTIKLIYCHRQSELQQAWMAFNQLLIKALMNQFPNEKPSIVTALANMLARQLSTMQFTSWTSGCIHNKRDDSVYLSVHNNRQWIKSTK